MQERPMNPSQKIVATLRDKQEWETLAKIDELEELASFTNSGDVNTYRLRRLATLKSQISLLREDSV